MSEISVAAASLRTLLSSLRHTLGRPGDSSSTDGVLLTTLTADTPEGRTKVLVGVTTDGVVVGRLSVLCNGELRAPLLIPADDVTWISEVLAEAVRDDKESLMSVRVDSESGVARMVVESRPSKVHSFPLGDVSAFPTAWTGKVLDEPAAAVVHDRTGKELPAGNLMALPGPYLALFMKMSRTFRGVPVKLYRTGHPAARVLVEVGPWRGSFPTSPYTMSTPVDFPETQVPADMRAESDDPGTGP